MSDTDGVAPLELTILMPCLNEAETVVTCIQKAQGFLSRSGIAGEVVVADNGSTDGSIDLARKANARVVHVQEKGYGSALLGGMRAAKGRFVILADADDSYDFSELDAFVQALRQGYQLVIGNRFLGGIRAHAMPPLHRYLGNPVLSFVGRLMFSARIRDFHCGLRGVDRNAMLGLGLNSKGMEFASEMIVKAKLAGWRMTEVPTVLYPAGRSRPPHLRSWRDGWRHLRFLLMMSPRWLMLYPGTTLIALGLASEAAILRGPVVIDGVGFDIHTMLYAAGLTILGTQLVLFSLVARCIGVVKQALPMTPSLSRFLRIFTLERGIVLGLFLSILGFVLAVYSVDAWAHARLAAMDPATMMRVAIPSVTFMLAGAEIIFASFLLSFMDVRWQSPHPQ
ncbi:MAG: glycosyltransferase family 2 protein [Burkholderiaceae bacterium]|jgi:glycosyltransferase involved in cell wall biosynthesis